MSDIGVSRTPPCGWDRNRQRRLGREEGERGVLASGILGSSQSGSVDASDCQTKMAPARLDRGPRAQPRCAVDRPRVRDLNIRTRAVEAPAVEWADDTVFVDRAADGDIGAQMRTVCVEHVWRSGAGAVTDQPPAEVVQADDLPGVDVSAVGDLEPTLGVGVERKSLPDVTHLGVTARLDR
jgi:hypothetical protein